MSSHVSSRFHRLLLSALVVFAGCGKIKEKLEGKADDPAAAPVVAAPADPPPDAAQPLQAVPSAKDVVATFLALPPQQKNDDNLLAASEQTAEIAGIEELVLAGGGVSDGGIVALPKFTGLKRLDLSGARITAKSLETIAQLPAIESLKLNAIPLEDTALAALKPLPALTELSLVGTSIGESAFEPLAALEHLRILDLSGNDQVLGRSFSEQVKQKRFAALTSLTADNSGFGFYGLAEIGTLPHLEFLSAVRSSVSDEALLGAEKSRSLKRLYLGNNLITDAGLKSLKKLTQLEELRLEGNLTITDAGLKDLRPLRQLKELRLDGTRCTESEVRQLKQNLPSTVIYFAGQKL